MYDVEAGSPPTHLFAEVLARYGIVLDVGDESGYFVARAETGADEGPRSRDVTEKMDVVTFARRNKETQRMEWTWAYSIRRDEYFRETRRHAAR